MSQPYWLDAFVSFEPYFKHSFNIYRRSERPEDFVMHTRQWFKPK
jgi:hypothetical protein